MIADILSDVIELARPVEDVKTEGVYFLIDRGRVVYVGQSVSCQSRITQHICENIKIFDSFTIVRVIGGAARRQTEKDLIDALSPRYNRTSLAERGLVFLADVSKETGADFGDLFNLVRTHSIPSDPNYRNGGNRLVRKDKLYEVLATTPVCVGKQARKIITT